MAEACNVSLSPPLVIFYSQPNAEIRFQEFRFIIFRDRRGLRRREVLMRSFIIITHILYFCDHHLYHIFSEIVYTLMNKL